MNVPVVWAVYDSNTGIAESIFLAKNDAIERSNWLIEKTDTKYGVYPLAYEPANDAHWHYRISQLTPEKVESDACYNPMCSQKPRYWKGEQYKYWSVDSCDEALTRLMAERLSLGGDLDSY